MKGTLRVSAIASVGGDAEGFGAELLVPDGLLPVVDDQVMRTGMNVQVAGLPGQSLEEKSIDEFGDGGFVAAGEEVAVGKRVEGFLHGEAVGFGSVGRGGLAEGIGAGHLLLIGAGDGVADFGFGGGNQFQRGIEEKREVVQGGIGMKSSREATHRVA